MGNLLRSAREIKYLVLDVVDDRPPHVPNVNIADKLGSGYFGNVWRGTWAPEGNIPGLTVALKVPNGRARRDSALLKSFRREGEIVKELDHPNIIEVKLVSEHNGLPFIIMELAEKGSLKEFAESLRGQPHLTGGRTRCWMCVGVASGMEYLERKRIVHRDLAARNVLVTGEGTCKITDFGLTRQMIAQTEHGSIEFLDNEYAYTTGNPGVALPVLWSAPEVFEGHSTSKSDVWSFGVMLWEVLSFGATPYMSASTPGIRTPRGINRPVLISYLENGGRLQRPDGCRGDVYQLMQDTWALKPEERPRFADIRTRLQSIAGPVKGSCCVVL